MRECIEIEISPLLKYLTGYAQHLANRVEELEEENPRDHAMVRNMRKRTADQLRSEREGVLGMIASVREQTAHLGLIGD